MNNPSNSHQLYIIIITPETLKHQNSKTVHYFQWKYFNVKLTSKFPVHIDESVHHQRLIKCTTPYCGLIFLPLPANMHCINYFIKLVTAQFHKLKNDLCYKNMYLTKILGFHRLSTNVVITLQNCNNIAYYKKIN